MPRFLTGDELGNIKSFKYAPSSAPESKVTVTTLYNGSGKGKDRAVQNLAIHDSGDGPLIAAARADGSASVSRLHAQDLNTLHEWTEPRLKPAQRYVGLAASSAGVYSCTSNGALRLTPLLREADAGLEQPRTAVLPMRLCAWRLAPDGTTFAYGGDEVELSVWDVETAFAPKQQPPAPPQSDSSKKRKRRSEMFLPGELWRAKNVANDNLSLRQPVHNTCLTYISTTSQHLLAGTQRGDIRRYDTRAARKPVAEWKQIVPTGSKSGVGVIEKGLHEHEVFVSDQTSNLFAIDARKGRVIYGYSGIAGAVTSIAPSPVGLVSTALDRYARVHTAFPPPAEAGQPQDDKATVLEKVYMKSIPTCAVWDGIADEDEDTDHETRGGGDGDGDSGDDDDDDDDDDVWEGMKVAEDSDDEGETQARRRRTERK